MALRTSPLPLATFVAGLSCGLAFSALAGPGSFGYLDVFSKAFSIIESRYVDERDPDELVYDAIGGLTQGLDDHSVFLDPEAYRSLRDVTRGEYSGIGVDVVTEDGVIEVQRVLQGSPAEKAGLVVGDQIVSVDDTQLQEVGAVALMERIRGEQDTLVLVGVLRTGAAAVLRFSVRRDNIKTASVFVDRLPRDVVRLRVDRFQRDTYEEVKAALDSFGTEGSPLVSGIILDLRANPGGYLSEAVDLANLWISSGALVSTIGRSASAERDLATAKGTDSDTPLTVIVDSRSASAAEVLAGALRDHGRARIIGYPTYGKASVQRFFDLPDGSALKLTTAHYFTPGGHHIHGVGITPDLVLGPRGASQPDFALDSLPGYPSELTAQEQMDPEVGVALAWLSSPDRVDAWFGARAEASAE